MTLEKRHESWFRKEVEKRGGWTVKFAPLIRGNPDRIVMIRGTVYLVELKTEGGSLSPIQQWWHDKAARTGVKVVVLEGRTEMRAWLDHVAPKE